MSTTTEQALTIPDAEWIATEATRRLSQIYRDYGWSPCPRLSPGTIRVVLEVAAERAAATRPEWSGTEEQYATCPNCGYTDCRCAATPTPESEE